MLNDVPEIDQRQMENIVRFSIRSGQNVLVLGPSGAGKTYIAFKGAAEEGCRLVYVNLSVLERTDFQGLPTLTEDRTSVSYAVPEFLPFADTRIRDEFRALTGLRDYLSDNGHEKTEKIFGLIKRRELEIENDRRLSFLKNNVSYIKSLEKNGKLSAAISNAIESAVTSLPNDKPIVFLFDEVDKAAHEVLQTLLEFLQFHSVNGRKLDIKSCILTGNLPDEFANSQQISHAITKRGMTFKLSLDFNQWREWAFKNDVHQHIIGFLTSDNKYLYKKPIDNDPTAYALPSPRTWVSASDALKNLESDKVFAGMRNDTLSELQLKLIAGHVGDTAAITFNNWLKFYRDLDPVVNELVEKGKKPDMKKLDTQQIFICALSAVSKIYAELKDKNDDKIFKYTKNVFEWIVDLQPDVQIGAARMAFGGDFEIIRKYKLSEIPEFVKVFKELKKVVNDN